MVKGRGSSIGGVSGSSGIAGASRVAYRKLSWPVRVLVSAQREAHHVGKGSPGRKRRRGRTMQRAVKKESQIACS